MAWRTLVISNPARIWIKDNQLVITQQDSVSLPVEDISVLIIESQEVVVTSALLARLAEYDVLLLVCNNAHMPCMAGIAYAGHSRLSGMHKIQLSISSPLKKRCWQSVIKQKIKNQAKCLQFNKCAEYNKLEELIPKVLSGDTSNVESNAAKIYFKMLFGNSFIRGADNTINSALNYGYAVIRAAIARAFSVHGFILSQGIHHKSELNPFNLIDDFIEPFRPVVDLCAAKNIYAYTEFNKGFREHLISLLHNEILIDDERHTVLNAADIMAESFIKVCKNKDPKALKLPCIIPLKMHSYE